jgi:hypothetical protein
MTMVDANAVKLRRRLKDRAKPDVGKPPASTSPQQTVVDPQRETGNDGCPGGMWIHRARRRAKSLGGCRFDRLPLRETCAPFA